MTLLASLRLQGVRSAALVSCFLAVCSVTSVSADGVRATFGSGLDGQLSPDDYGTVNDAFPSGNAVLYGVDRSSGIGDAGDGPLAIGVRDGSEGSERLSTSAIAAPVPLDPPAGALSGAAPSSNALFQMQKDNRRHPWLRITTDSGRTERKALRFDAIGLSGLSAPDGSQAPGPLPWSRIQRIDEVVTGAGTWSRVGAVTAGIIGFGINVDEGAGMALGGLLAFGGAGAYLGDRFGSRFRSERNWYIADTGHHMASEALPEPMAATSMSVADTAGIALIDTTATLNLSVADEAILQACGRIRRDEQLRIYGTFGAFEGRAGIVGPGGVEGLQVRRTRRTPEPGLPQRITWDEIDRIEVRRGSALMGAMGGGAVFAGFGALLGTALVAVSSTSEVSVGTGAIMGAFYVAPVGIVLGGLGGVMVRRWVPVYRRG